MKTGFFRQARDLKIQRKNPGSALCKANVLWTSGCALSSHSIIPNRGGLTLQIKDIKALKTCLIFWALSHRSSTVGTQFEVCIGAGNQARG